jgi:hypothetical protein
MNQKCLIRVSFHSAVHQTHSLPCKYVTVRETGWSKNMQMSRVQMTNQQGAATEFAAWFYTTVYSFAGAVSQIQIAYVQKQLSGSSCVQ